MTFLNYTPHAVNCNGFTWEAELPPIRLEEIDFDPAMVAGVPVVQRAYASAMLPAERDGVGLIVSQMIAAAYPERRDLYYPGALERDKDGKVTGCSNLAQIYVRP